MAENETENKENFISGLFSVVPDHNMVLFTIPYYPGCFRTYHERELYCVCHYAHSFHVFWKSMVWVSLPGRRPSGMSFYVQSETCETRMAKQNKVYNLGRLDDRNNHNVYPGKK